MLRAPRKPLPSPLTDGNQVATWVDGWAVHQLNVNIPVPASVGRWLIRQGLYARGTDFTSGFADQLGYSGNSTLKELWSGSCGSRTEGMSGAKVFVLTRNGVAQGVVCCTHPEGSEEGVPWQWFNKTPGHPNHAPKERVAVARLGHVMAFLKPAHRKQGLVRRAVEDLVLPKLHAQADACVAQGAMPVLGASDAMAKMLKPITTLPLVTDLTVCRGMRDEVWSMLTWAKMRPEKPHRSARYLVPAQPIPVPTKKRLRP